MPIHDELSSLIRREATLRDLTIADLAALADMPRTTVNAYLRGHRAMPNLAARALLTALHDHGPFRIREAEVRAVIHLTHYLPLHTLRMVKPSWWGWDTLILQLESDTPQDRVNYMLSCPPFVPAKVKGLYDAVKGDGVVVGRPRYSRYAHRWQVQVNWSRRTDRPMLRGVFSLLKPTQVHLCRADLAFDYPVPTASLLLYSRYVRTVSKVTSDKRGLTWGYNSRKSQRFIRVYDKAAQLGLDAAKTRIEVEWKPRPIPTLADWLRSPFNLADLQVGTLLAPNLEHDEAAALLYERELRTMRNATAPLPAAMEKALASARRKMAESDALIDPSVFLTERHMEALWRELRSLVPQWRGPNSGPELPPYVRSPNPNPAF
ncbi:MAG: hypothetical protein ACON4N_13245 [Myxococcota bacterium]